MRSRRSTLSFRSGCRCCTVLVMLKLNNTQVARAAEHYVVAEIHRRGGYAACFGGNMPLIDVMATDVEHRRTVTIQVKAKSGGRDWQTSTTRGRPRAPEDEPTRFWIMVDLAPEAPTYYVMPEWWIQNNIHEAHAAYLARHGGQRARSTESTHHAIQIDRIDPWRDHWNLLGIFSDQSGARPMAQTVDPRP